MSVRVLVGFGVAFGAACATTTARADEPQPVFIWYRSGGGCPDGNAFLSQLDGKVDGARIAVAGDPIDFVVTLGSLGKRSNGRLEKETRQGKVAIREIDAEDCGQVAEALALSLTLAIDPAEKPAQNPEEPPPSQPDLTPRAAASRSRPAVSKDPRLDGGATPREHGPWAVGAQGMLATAIAPALLPGANAFLDVESRQSGMSARLGALGLFGAVNTAVGEVRYRLLGGRLEGCPFRMGTNDLNARPCLAVDLGQLRVQGLDGDEARSDTGLWAAANVIARVSWQAASSVALEAQAGAFVPFTRYTLETGDPTIDGDRTSFVGFSAGLGARALLP